jgi:translocon-associated protein subunit beta
MKLILIFILAVISTVSAIGLDDSDDAQLFVVKTIQNNYIVQDLDVSIKYTIYNTGSVPALNVKLIDENFPSTKFEYVSGFTNVKWPKISPSTNVSHIAVVRPKIVGLFNFTSATVIYNPNEKSQKVQVGYSTEAGEIYIQRIKDYNRKFASHLVIYLISVQFC